MCTLSKSEHLLNHYVDGELPSTGQAELFAHLALCEGCRLQFNALLEFRLASRQEAFPVPLSADEAVFARIDRLRRKPRLAVERVAARRFFGGQIQRHVSVRSALFAAVVLIGFALAVRPNVINQSARTSYHVTEAIMDDGALYVIGPGLTVVDEKITR